LISEWNPTFLGVKVVIPLYPPSKGESSTIDESYFFLSFCRGKQVPYTNIIFPPPLKGETSTIYEFYFPSPFEWESSTIYEYYFSSPFEGGMRGMTLTSIITTREISKLLPV